MTLYDAFTLFNHLVVGLHCAGFGSAAVGLTAATGGPTLDDLETIYMVTVRTEGQLDPEDIRVLTDVAKERNLDMRIGGTSAGDTEVHFLHICDDCGGPCGVRWPGYDAAEAG